MIQSWENVDRFEEIVAEYAGSKYAVATDSCTNSIFLCLKYYESVLHALNREKPVQVPKHTFLSIPQTVIHAGFNLEFVDRDWVGSYRLRPYSVADSATRFYSGMYEDIGCEFACLSFHIKKFIPIGRGGMILTNNKTAVKWLKQARNDGRKSIFFNDIKDIDVLGYHMFMTPEQAARGIELFYRLPKVNKDLASWENYPDVSKYTCFKSV
jgi:dTDP-4-amino-4,6-dideoxygalactose transaminase